MADRSSVADRVILGTAQFGSSYGINNKNGRPSAELSYEILNSARREGIALLDTARLYGECEKIVGTYLKEEPQTFGVVAKAATACGMTIAESVAESFRLLGVSTFYGLLHHHFADFLSDEQSFDHLKGIKEAGKTERIGFSLYRPKELDYLFDRDISFDLIQLPYNILDRRFERYFPALKERGVEIHIRSVFLQGLLFKRDIPAFFHPIKETIREVQRLGEEGGVAGLCLEWVLANPFVDYLVIGVDSVENLTENLRWNPLGNVIEKAARLQVNEEKFLLPFLWEDME